MIYVAKSRLGQATQGLINSGLAVISQCGDWSQVCRGDMRKTNNSRKQIKNQTPE